jgi:hypothetical protein
MVSCPSDALALVVLRSSDPQRDSASGGRLDGDSIDLLCVRAVDEKPVDLARVSAAQHLSRIRPDALGAERDPAVPKPTGLALNAQKVVAHVEYEVVPMVDPEWHQDGVAALR